MSHPERIRSIHPSAPPATDAGALAAAAAAAVEQMNAEGRSGRVTVSMSVEVQQYPDHQVGQHGQPAHREWEDRRFAIVLSIVVGILSGLFVASLPIVPDLLGAVAGAVMAAWILSKANP